jgi:pilus assembly protein CpaB
VGRLRGFVWLFAGLVVAGLAGIVAFAALTQAMPEVSAQEETQFTVTVVTAARVIPVRTVLTREDVEIKEVPVDAVPEGAIAGFEDAEGMITLVDLYPGEILLDRRLLDPNVTTGDGRMALYVTEDQVLMAIPADDLLTTMNVLKPGDRVDLVISMDFPINREMQAIGAQSADGTGSTQDEEPATFCVLQNVGIAAIIGGPTQQGENQSPLGGQGTNSTDRPRALLVTINPQDALVLKFALDSEGMQSILLRAPGVDRPFDMEPVDVDYVINRYQIPTRVGE